MYTEGILLAETHFLASKLLQPKSLAMSGKWQLRELPCECIYTMVCTSTSVCVCIEAGHWPFYSSHTVQPSIQPCTSCSAQGLHSSLCSSSSQWWAGWSDPLQKAAQTLAMLLWDKQIEQKSKPKIPGRAEVGCGQESEAYGLLH